MTEIAYKYSEDKILDEVEKYIEATYNSHYSKSKKYQSIDGIFASGNGRGFCIGNIQKYADRLYSKGTVADARLDLIKIIHYAILAIHNHDQLYAENQVKVGNSTLSEETQAHIDYIHDAPPRQSNTRSILRPNNSITYNQLINYANTAIRHEPPIWNSIGQWPTGEVVED